MEITDPSERPPALTSPSVVSTDVSATVAPGESVPPDDTTVPSTFPPADPTAKNFLITGADNTKLEAHYRTLMNQLAYSRLVTTSLDQPGRAMQSEREHHVVLDLILAKDGDSAERVMREHVRASRSALLAGLDLST